MRNDVTLTAPSPEVFYASFLSWILEEYKRTLAWAHRKLSAGESFALLRYRELGLEEGCDYIFYTAVPPPTINAPAL